MAKNKNKIDNYKTKECKVIGYFPVKDLILIDFNGIGISFAYSNIPSDTVKVRYTGEIGTKNFTCELIR